LVAQNTELIPLRSASSDADVGVWTRSVRPYLPGRRVVDKRRQGPECLHRSVDCLPHVVLVVDVTAGERCDAVVGGNRVHHALPVGRIAAGDNDLGAFPGECPRDGLADPAWSVISAT